SARQGSGLGLYITRCIVEAHGGALRLEPHTAEGQGTTFSFDLPLHRAIRSSRAYSHNGAAARVALTWAMLLMYYPQVGCFSMIVRTYGRLLKLVDRADLGS